MKPRAAAARQPPERLFFSALYTGPDEAMSLYADELLPPSQPGCSEQSDYQRAVGRVVSPLTRRFGAAALGHPGSRWERGAPSGHPCASAQRPFQRLAAFSPRKEGGYLGFLCVWGALLPPHFMRRERASKHAQQCPKYPNLPVFGVLCLLPYGWSRFGHLYS